MRNVLIRRESHPPKRTPLSGQEGLLQALHSGSLTAEELLCRYSTLVYTQTGSYEETARRLHLDRRTVKRQIDAQLLAQCRTVSPALQ